ncbi:MAG TPA: hypothetical protein PLL30_10410 [Candidatus Krumholzibacteria bacterium]|nr:hypothetical protein [Candidatus Krumholzibacteria bacterium]HPD72174.1 hypothetical protein [Candidatus Krumholzibacteria bacterium]HRY40894.1 hypothetical protein [Candidatus Krumholzibacteria bacterium]
MRRPGRRSRTETAGSGRGGEVGGRRRQPPAVLVACWLALAPAAASALDLFTLWQRPELPLDLAAGQWADYRRQALTEGRRTDDLLRIQCLGQDAQGRWLLEVLPLVETDPAVFAVVPGEGLRLWFSGALAERTGSIVDAVDEVRLWRDGEEQVLDRREWRRDPLVTASFSGEFRPELVEEREATVRVISGRELTCRQMVFAAADTQVARLPNSTMTQTSSQEVSAAVNPSIPLLGLAYVTERLRAESRLDPPSDRLSPPPPQIRVEILECIDFGSGARPALGPVPMGSD